LGDRLAVQRNGEWKKAFRVGHIVGTGFGKS
jgi:hypothetical protein